VSDWSAIALKISNVVEEREMYLSRWIRSGAVVCALAAAVTVGVSASIASASTKVGHVTSGKTIAWIQIAANNPFFTAENVGAAAAAKKAGFTFRTVSGNDSAATQSQEVEQLTNEHVSAILITAIDPASMTASFRYAKEHGVPVISLYSTSSLAAMSAGFDEVAVGQTMAAFSANLLKERYGSVKGQVAVLGLSLGQTLEKYRIGGFVNYMKKYPGVKVVAQEPTNSEADQAQSLMQDWLTRFPDLSLVYGGSDTITVPAITVAQRSNKVCDVTTESWKKNPSCILFSSVDGDPIGITAIEHGTLAGTDLYAPYWAGYQFAMIGYNLAAKKIKAQTTVLQALPVDRTNVSCIAKMQNAMAAHPNTFNFNGTLAQIAARYNCKAVSIPGVTKSSGEAF
jgi:ABC-type sugar transport system substrate-binding protein